MLHCLLLWNIKKSKTLGYVKGDDLTKKLYSSSLGGILASKFGDICEVERLVMKNKINIIPTANLRGIEFEEDSIIFHRKVKILIYIH